MVDYVNNSNNETFRRDVKKSFISQYDVDGLVINGSSVSYCMQHMRDEGWKNLGNLNVFETLLEEAGFRIMEGRTMRMYANGKVKPGARCRVVAN